jgi:hypothetical protein
VVRLSEKVYEAITARVGRRPRYALYHTALVVDVSDGRVVIESAPIGTAKDENVASSPKVLSGRVEPADSGCSATEIGRWR